MDCDIFMMSLSIMHCTAALVESIIFIIASKSLQNGNTSEKFNVTKFKTINNIRLSNFVIIDKCCSRWDQMRVINS